MRKSWLTKAAVLGVCAACAAAASAQSNGASGLSARVGAQWPNTGSANFAAGLDYKFSNFAVQEARPGYLSYLGLSADYYGRNGDNWNVPLAVTYNIRANQLVFSAGIGVDIFEHHGDSQSGLGGQLAVAYEFGATNPTTVNPLFVEAKYFFANDSDLSGFGLYLGYRF